MLKRGGMATLALAGMLAFAAAAPQKANAAVHIGVVLGAPVYSYPATPYPYGYAYPYGYPTYSYPYVSPGYGYGTGFGTVGGYWGGGHWDRGHWDHEHRDGGHGFHGHDRR